MKILKHGTIKDWELEVTCCYCKAVLVLDNSDDMYHKLALKHNPYQFSQTKYYFKCPDCGRSYKVDEYYIRDDVLKEIPRG